MGLRRSIALGAFLIFVPGCGHLGRQIGREVFRAAALTTLAVIGNAIATAGNQSNESFGPAEDAPWPDPGRYPYKTILTQRCAHGASYSLLCGQMSNRTYTCFYQTSTIRVYECRTVDCNDGVPEELVRWCEDN